MRCGRRPGLSGPRGGSRANLVPLTPVFRWGAGADGARLLVFSAVNNVFPWKTEICPICPRLVAEGPERRPEFSNFIVSGAGRISRQKHIVYSTCQPIVSSSPAVSEPLDPRSVLPLCRGGFLVFRSLAEDARLRICSRLVHAVLSMIQVLKLVSASGELPRFSNGSGINCSLAGPHQSPRSWGWG